MKGGFGLWCLLGALPAVLAGDERPNVVFILTDDQDTHMSGLEHMPLTQKYLQDKGTTFDKHYCTGKLVPLTYNLPLTMTPVSLNLLPQPC